MSKIRTDTERLDWLEYHGRGVETWRNALFNTPYQDRWQVEGEDDDACFTDLRDAIDAAMARQEAYDAEQSRP